MTLAVLCLAIAVAAAIQIVSGFGFALVSAPLLVALTDPVTSVSILAVLGTAISALALLTAREPLEVLRRECGLLLVWSVPGIVAGALVIDRLPDDVVRAAIGVLVLAALAQRHLLPGVRHGGGSVGRAAAGLTSGAMTTSTGLNGPPLVLFLTARGTPARALRDTLAVLFLAMGVAAIGALAAAGNLQLPTDAAALPVAALAGVLAGHRIFDRMSDAAREGAITAMLVLAALTALGAALV